MSEQNVQAQPETQAAEPFDFAEWKKQYEARNAGQAPVKVGTKPASGDTKTPEDGTKAAKTETRAPVSDPDGEGEDDEAEGAPRLPRSVTRRLNKLQRENGELAGRLAMLQELQASGMTRTQATQQVAAAQADSEPKRENYASDAEYFRAVGRHEAKAVVAEEKATQAGQVAQAAMMQGVDTSNAKFSADIAEYPDWADVMDSMADVDIDLEKHQTFVGLLSSTDQRAALLYHLAKNRPELTKLLAMNPNAQIAAFHRLEGRLEKVHTEEQPDSKKKVETKPTAAELDARKPKPSAAVGGRGGIAAPAKTAMTLEDGVTINPQWKAEQNAKLGIRP